jgi:hypothetical protein
LFYFIVDEFEESSEWQKLEVGENISFEWKTFEEIKELCKNGSISEDRTLGILFRFFLHHSVI